MSADLKKKQKKKKKKKQEEEERTAEEEEELQKQKVRISIYEHGNDQTCRSEPELPKL